SEEYNYLHVVITYLESVISDELMDQFSEVVEREYKHGEAVMKNDSR
ncbi:MAG: hypothetical protein GX089_07315, partial [Fibrobacter sp.]|nr:hypothetical protein [Fibrobacter sp.]